MAAKKQNRTLKNWDWAREERESGQEREKPPGKREKIPGQREIYFGQVRDRHTECGQMRERERESPGKCPGKGQLSSKDSHRLVNTFKVQTP